MILPGILIITNHNELMNQNTRSAVHKNDSSHCTSWIMFTRGGFKIDRCKRPTRLRHHCSAITPFSSMYKYKFYVKYKEVLWQQSRVQCGEREGEGDCVSISASQSIPSINFSWWTKEGIMLQWKTTTKTTTFAWQGRRIAANTQNTQEKETGLRRGL